VTELVWTIEAAKTFNELKSKAQAALKGRQSSGKRKSGKEEGLFKQVNKCVQHLASNPRHPGLQTHAYQTIVNPYEANEKVFEAYAQQKTPAAYRVFWCYGPDQGQITIIAITPHP
jgi:hypothetical protein